MNERQNSIRSEVCFCLLLSIEHIRFWVPLFVTEYWNPIPLSFIHSSCSGIGMIIGHENPLNHYFRNLNSQHINKCIPLMDIVCLSLVLRQFYIQVPIEYVYIVTYLWYALLEFNLPLKKGITVTMLEFLFFLCALFLVPLSTSSSSKKIVYFFLPPFNMIRWVLSITAIALKSSKLRKL